MVPVQVAADIRAAGGQAISFAGDVTAEEFAHNAVQATLAEFEAVDILVNNAGRGFINFKHNKGTRKRHVSATVVIFTVLWLLYFSRNHLVNQGVIVATLTNGLQSLQMLVASEMLLDT